MGPASSATGDGRRFIRVVANVERDALGDIARTVNKEFIPTLEAKYPGLSVLKGGIRSQAEFFVRLTLCSCALYLYALIAVAFRSYSLPLLIMTAIPFISWGYLRSSFVRYALALFSTLG